MTQPTPPDLVTLEIADIDDLRLPHGWRSVENESVTEVNGLATVERAPFHQEGESSIGGATMLIRSIELGERRGLRTARAMCRQQDLIPEVWGDSFLEFPGTVIEHLGGDRAVACLERYGGRWKFVWSCLSRNRSRHYRVVRSRTLPSES